MNYRTGNWTDDLFCLQYKEKKLVDISKEDLDLGEEDEDTKAKSAEIEEEYKPLTDWILETLGADKVEKVAVSK
jgi:heat shock protein beta